MRQQKNKNMVEQFKQYYSRSSEKIIKVAAFVGALVILVNGYFIYVNNVYKPTVEILKVDYDKGYAKIKYRNREIEIYGDASFLLSGTWGIKLGRNNVDGKGVYDRIELTNNGMVYDYLK